MVTVLIDDQSYPFHEQAFNLVGVPLNSHPAIILCGSSMKAENPLIWIIL